MSRACREWNASLLDRAAGAPASHGLDDHLAACPACRSRLEQLARRARIHDGLLQASVRGKQPRPGFEQRLLTRATRPKSALGWLAATATIAIIGTVAWIGWPGRLDRAAASVPWSQAIEIAAWESPTASLLDASSEGIVVGAPQFRNWYFELEPPGGSAGETHETP